MFVEIYQLARRRFCNIGRRYPSETRVPSSRIRREKLRKTGESDLYSLWNFVGSACSIRAIFGLPKRGSVSVFPCCTLEIHLPDWWDCNILLNSCPCPVLYRTPDFIVNSFRRVSPIREHFSCYFFLWSIFVGEALLGLPTWLGRLQPCLPVNTSVTGPDLNTNTTDCEFPVCNLATCVASVPGSVIFWNF